ncbi:DUF397 domain-containing protein [Actinopolyspora erythraea]|uniref:DUF397 domain-containing protein n=1 Tax=Actinopolyspora erythraea TaxID=414996 RepID=A0A099D9B7_9ACTN|nr:DUF397 domain-containing protein [Actinopolyspora erythraea]ASU80560.1 DUF397 domain-containing protein [Actinopolyspora erythraea]KGI82763.1 hypothetical protein IL38_02480 [Actinopolyspora erythraea]
MTTPDFSQARWYKSGRSNGGGSACVMVAHVPTATGVADSKLGEDSPVLPFGKAAWSSFVEALKSDRFGG